jgi:serine/threonine-protein kinase
MGEPAPDVDRRRRIDRLVHEFHAACVRGERPDTGAWLERHPDLALELGAYLRDLETAQTQAVPSAGGSVDFDPSTVIYRAPAESTIGSTRDCAAPERLGDYEVLEPLDAGGEGMVFRARHRLNDHVVALKMIRPSLSRNAEAEHRLREEARAIAALRHDHIVPIHFVGEDSGTWYYTMPLMPGGSLKGRNNEAPIDLQGAARVLEQVARGIHHAHSRGVLHLDLKPANVLLDDLGRPYVSDFGLALRVHATEQADVPERDPGMGEAAPEPSASVSLTSPQIRGTAPFMAPEVASGHTSVFSTAADVYGLGALLYTQITGRPPFGGASLSDTLRRVTTERPVRPRLLNRRIDSELQAVCLKCLEKVPNERYGSADAFANDVARWLRGEPTLAGGSTWAKRARFAVRRHPWMVSLAAFGTLALALAAQVGSLKALHDAGARDAHRLAGYVGKELAIVRRVLIDAQAAPELVAALHDQPAGSREQRQALDAFLLHKTADFQVWFGLGIGSPLVNIFVVDADGILRADTGPGGAAIGRSFARRDYFRHSIGQNSPASSDGVYVSRVFHSIMDGRYKMALAVPVRLQSEQLGVLIANLTLGARLGMVDLTDEPIGASIVSPMDWSYSENGDVPPDRRAPFVAAFDRRYAEPDRRGPIWVSVDDAPRLPDFLAKPTLTTAHTYGHLGCALLYERVGDSPLVVVIRQNYPLPASLLFDERLRPILLAIAVVALAALAWPIARRHYRRPRGVGSA